jgi:hypothetical protein
MRDLVGRGLEVVEEVELEVVDEAARHLVGDAVLVGVFVGARGGRALQLIERTVEAHSTPPTIPQSAFGDAFATGGPLVKG